MSHEWDLDCRTVDGITVGLVQSVIMICRVLKLRALTSPVVVEALRDLVLDEDVTSVFLPGLQAAWPAGKQNEKGQE